MQLVIPDPEWTALEAGLKPAVRIAMRPGDAERLAAGLRARGAVVLEAAEPVRFGGGEPETILYVARSRERAQALQEAERATLDQGSAASRTEAHRLLGRLLGYPPCCVEAFVAVAARFDEAGGGAEPHEEDVLHARAALAGTLTTPCARLNPLLLTSRLRIITFYPCRYDCPAALAYADALHGALARKDPKAAAALDEALACTIALSNNGARACLTAGPGGRREAHAPPRPRGMPDLRGDGAYARALRQAFARGEPGSIAVLVSFVRAP